MFRRIVVPFCLLFLCMGLTVQADTPSEDENTAISGQTEVTARVEASETAQEEGQPLGKEKGMPPDSNTGADNRRYNVMTGDTDGSTIMLFLFLISSIVLVAEKLRRTAR